MRSGLMSLGQKPSSEKLLNSLLAAISSRWQYCSRTVLVQAKFFLGIQNNLAYQPGPVLLPGGDGSPLNTNYWECFDFIRRRLLETINEAYFQNYRLFRPFPLIVRIMTQLSTSKMLRTH